MTTTMRVTVFGLLLCLCGIPLTAGNAAAQSPAGTGSGTWLKDPITGCAVWNSGPHRKEVISWSGACEDGKAAGQGFLIWFTDGELTGRFEGHMEAGKAQGVGKLDFLVDDGFAHYEGDFLNSEMHGWGAANLPDKSRVEGDFQHDKLEGFVNYKGNARNLVESSDSPLQP